MTPVAYSDFVLISINACGTAALNEVRLRLRTDATVLEANECPIVLLANHA